MAEARPEALQALLARVPVLDGELCCDLETRESFARDAGGLVSKLPGAVLRPGSSEDVVRVVGLCHRFGVRAVARGQGHTTLGQAQVEAGILIDLRSLARVHQVDADSVQVDAGCTWRAVLDGTAPFELAPPVLTGFQGLTVGGTLSVGGISGTAYKRGSQLEQVLELQVVTGEGCRLDCSASQNRGLFEAVLGGLGHCALIVGAKLRLGPRPKKVLVTTITFDRSAAFLGGLRELARRARVDSLSANVYVPASREARFEINALVFDRAELAADAVVPELPGERFRTRCELPYLEHCLQVDRLLENLAPSGGWQERAHPWFDAFLPDSRFEAFLDEVLPSLDPSIDLGPDSLGALGQIHVFPLLTSHLQKPLLRVPNEPLVYLFDILTSAHGRGVEPEYRRRMLARNQALFARARALGGTRYNIAALPLSRASWATELGEAFAPLAEQKRRHDPHDVLGSVCA